MLNFLSSLFQIETMITILVGMAAFATVLTVAAPFFETDQPQGAHEVGGPGARQAARGAAGPARDRRERKASRQATRHIVTQLVEGLNLRKIFEAESSRNLLRQAGLRSERHLVTYPRRALRRSAGAWPRSSSSIPPRSLPTRSPRRCASPRPCVGIVFGYYLPSIFLKNLVTAPPGFDQARLVGCARPAADLRRIGHVDRAGACSACRARSASASVPLAEELTLTVAELSYLQDRRKALKISASAPAWRPSSRS